MSSPDDFPGGVVELLTVRETAAALKVAPITVRRYIAAGRLPAVRVGRNVRIERTALERLLRPAAAPPDLAPELCNLEPFTFDSPLWEIVGIIKDDGPTDWSENKHTYLVEALVDVHDDG